MFITTPVYILLLITLWKNRNEETLKHAFFKLMMSIGIADVGTILNIFLTFRLAEWGWVPQIFIWLGGMSARIAMIGTNLFSIAQVLGILVVAVNRYTAFMMPLRHQKSRKSARVATNVEKAALNMSIVGFVHCIGLAISVYFFIAQEISWFGFHYNLVDIVVITFVNNLGNNLFSAINPYALLIFSKPVRTQFFKMYHIPMISIPFSGKTNVVSLGGESARAVGQIDKNIEL
uniref:G-protein coupled receptors family 1 profile domain-containing protein n=1 Tax=Plectus sambesii TaxID=2011161 RepID=A0A914XG54_9BILA